VTIYISIQRDSHLPNRVLITLQDVFLTKPLKGDLALFGFIGREYLWVRGSFLPSTHHRMPDMNSQGAIGFARSSLNRCDLSRYKHPMIGGT
jgi:hypothetical protein